MAEEKNQILEVLVKEGLFEKTSYYNLPTINFVYPNTMDGSSEAFRTDENRYKKGIKSIEERLSNKKIIYTFDATIFQEIDKIAPRLEIGDEMSGKSHSIYTLYRPILFIGYNKEDFTAYVVKPIPNREMVWFELSTNEIKEIQNKLIKKAEKIQTKYEKQPETKKEENPKSKPTLLEKIIDKIF